MDFDLEMKRVDEASKTTLNILSACEKLGVNVVGIGEKHEDLPSSMKHPFGAEGSVFAEGESDGWPVAWAIVRMAGISGGCGNPGQHQTRSGTKMLDGVYRRVNGVWSKDD